MQKFVCVIKRERVQRFVAMWHMDARQLTTGNWQPGAMSHATLNERHVHIMPSATNTDDHRDEHGNESLSRVLWLIIGMWHAE
ncbi:hypothetical protein ACLKA7_007177 [Drosophila subpalustris]